MGTCKPHLGGHRGASARTEDRERPERTGSHQYVHHIGQCELGKPGRFHPHRLAYIGARPRLYAHRHAEGTRPGALPHRNRVLPAVPADAMKSTKAKRNAARNKGRPHERMHRLMRTYVWGCAYICVRLHVYTCKLMHTSALPTYGKPTCGQTPGLSLRPSQIPENQLHLYRIEHPLPVGITRIRQSTVKHLVVMHP